MVGTFFVVASDVPRDLPVAFRDSMSYHTLFLSLKWHPRGNGNDLRT